MSVIQGVQPRPGQVRVLAADAAIVLARDDAAIRLDSTDAAVKAVTMTATQEGHIVVVFLGNRASTGSYTLAVSGGTVTLDATGEGVILAYDGTAWRHVGLLGTATFA